MSLANKIAKGTVIFSSSNVILTAIHFLTSVLVIRTLGALDYGWLALSLSAYSIGTVFLDLGLSNVISSEIARSRGKKRLDQVKRFLLRYSQMELGGGSLLLIVPILASPWINKAYSPMLARLFIIVGTYLFLTGIKNLFSTTFYSYTLYHYLTFLQVTFALLRLLWVLLLVIWLKQGLMGAILTYPLSLAITILLTSPFWWRVVSPLKKIKASKEPVFRKALKEQGGYVILTLPFKNIQDQLPPWMIKALLGTEMVAIYAVAQRGFSPLFSLLRSLETTLLPLASERISTDWQTTKTMLNKATKYASWVAALLVIGGWLLAPLFYRFLFSEKYLEAVPVFRIYLLVLFVYAFLLIQRPLLYALRAQKYLFYAYLMGVPFYILLLYLSISWLGVLGAALALSLHGVVIASLRYYFLHQLCPDFRISFKALFLIDEFDKRMFKEKILSRLQRVMMIL
ncbi:MAG: oligosaccharide flippase family protein [Candidatus Ranarchaeia archaeon]